MKLTRVAIRHTPLPPLICSAGLREISRWASPRRNSCRIPPPVMTLFVPGERSFHWVFLDSIMQPYAGIVRGDRCINQRVDARTHRPGDAASYRSQLEWVGSRNTDSTMDKGLMTHVVPQTATRISPRALFRTFAIAEMFTWAGLITAIILRTLDITNIVPIAGGIHGFVFLSYSASTVFVWVNQKWPAKIGVMGVLLAIVPFATVPFEVWVDRRGLLEGSWRLARGGEEPHGVIEHIQAWVLRNVVLAVVLLLVFLVALFLTLLWLGPPIPRS